MVYELYVNVLSDSEFAFLDLELSELELSDSELSDLELSDYEPALLDSKVLEPDSVSVGVVSPNADLRLDS